MKTIMITGSSSGYGLETARYFLSKDWNVIATMRIPARGHPATIAGAAHPAVGRHG